MKIPRNSPCPCQSGLKYKQCCGNEAKLAEKRAIEHAEWLAKMKEKAKYIAKTQGNKEYPRASMPLALYLYGLHCNL